MDRAELVPEKSVSRYFLGLCPLRWECSSSRRENRLSGRLPWPLWPQLELDDLPPSPARNPFHALREPGRHVKPNYFCHGQFPQAICSPVVRPCHRPSRHLSFAFTTMVSIGAKSFHTQSAKHPASVPDAVGQTLGEPEPLTQWA